MGVVSLVPLPGGDVTAAPDLSRLEAVAAGFLAEYTGHTRAAYTRDLRDFFAWCATHDLPPLSAARPHVQLYLRTLEESGRAPATIARRLSTVSGLFRYALDEGFIDRSPVAHMRRPKVSDDSPTLGLDKAEAVAMLNAAEAAGPLEHALVCLLFLNGLRVSEVCGANITDLGSQRGHRTVTVTRKGGRKVDVPLAPRTAAAVEEQMADRQLGPLLVTVSKRRLDRKTAARIVARLARQVVPGRKISPHSLRHTFVTLALDAGVALRDVQDAAGHADPRTTRRYDRGRQSLDRHATYALSQFVA